MACFSPGNAQEGVRRDRCRCVLWRLFETAPYNFVMRVIAIGALAFSVLLQLVHAQDSITNLRSLYDSHRWFELRDKVIRTAAPRFYEGAVAAAFNQVPKAEKICVSSSRMIHRAILGWNQGSS
jgi:hypothetical protein